MNIEDVHELHFITPVQNLVSLLRLGLLSHEAVAKLPHDSVAMLEIQSRRAPKVVPNGLPLHSYVNLYFHARNPMLYFRKEQHSSLCVLRIDASILQLPQVVITSQNASSNYVRFYPSTEGLTFLEKDLVYAESWTHEDQIEEWRHKSIKCAEVLVPNRIDSVYIKGGYVSNQNTKTQLENSLKELNLALALSVDEHLFFLRNPL